MLYNYTVPVFFESEGIGSVVLYLPFEHQKISIHTKKREHMTPYFYSFSLKNVCMKMSVYSI